MPCWSAVDLHPSLPKCCLCPSVPDSVSLPVDLSSVLPTERIDYPILHSGYPHKQHLLLCNYVFLPCSWQSRFHADCLNFFSIPFQSLIASPPRSLFQHTREDLIQQEESKIGIISLRRTSEHVNKFSVQDLWSWGPYATPTEVPVKTGVFPKTGFWDFNCNFYNLLLRLYLLEGYRPNSFLKFCVCRTQAFDLCFGESAVFILYSSYC